MIKQYIKQAWFLLRENKLLSCISIVGTAMAICMIMCVVLVYEVKTANYEPEVNRDRTLSVEFACATGIKDNGVNSGGLLSLRVLKDCFYPLTSAEAVTALTPCEPKLVSSPGGAVDIKGFVSFTDDAFWKVFEFKFLSGIPYNEADFNSGIKKAVISRSLARTVFGTEEVVGRTVRLSFDDYTVCGVVADVPVLAEAAYAQAWVPYTTVPSYERSRVDGLLSMYRCYILAPSPDEVEAVREECLSNISKMNSTQKEMYLQLFGGPDTQVMRFIRNSFGSHWYTPNVADAIIIYSILIFILLSVPAINLSGITLSRMRKRMGEIGVRRAFGAERSTLLWQVLSENLVVTLIGGFVGLIFSYLAIIGLREWLLSSLQSTILGMNTDVNSQMVLQPSVFVLAFVFCLLMNLLSAGIPAYRVSRANIVNALNH